eukprot:Tbor_TRINITY_DN6022_c0_g2::TRINITY_DN6022_c0_g2_i3::g.10619::m.10619
MRRTQCCASAMAPSVYPFKKPFHETPFDQDRTYSKRFPTKLKRKNTYDNSWMRKGADPTGTGIGLHRKHPLSKLKGNMQRTNRNVPVIFNMMMQGVKHKSGITLYYNGGKPPNPSKHPYMLGTPCPVFGWRYLEPELIRRFEHPQVANDQIKYKPYVALHEAKLVNNVYSSNASSDSTPVSDKKPKEKSLLKKLFFWQ